MEIEITYEKDKESRYQVLRLLFSDYMESGGFESGEFMTTHMGAHSTDVTLFLSENNFERLAKALGDMARKIRADRRAAKENKVSA